MNSTCINECGREQNCCHNTWGKPGIVFSNKEGSWRSSVGLLVAGEKVSPGGKIGENLVLRGLEPTNSLIEMRGIKFHTGHNGEFYGVSQGCITLPGKEFRIGYEMLSNKTLIYAFEGNARQSYSGFDDNAEILKALRAKENTGFISVPSISTPTLERTMADSKAAKAKKISCCKAFAEREFILDTACGAMFLIQTNFPFPTRLMESRFYVAQKNLKSASYYQTALGKTQSLL